MQTPDKGRVPRMYREFLQLSKKTITQLKPWASDLNCYFTREDLWMADKQIKRHLTLLVIEKCKFKPQGDTTTHLLV